MIWGVVRRALCRWVGLCDLPVVIPDSEKIVRGIGAPQHYDSNKRRLKPAAFRPKAGECAVSVIRHAMGDDFCKNKSTRIVSNYVGVAVMLAKTARDIGSSVYDHRKDFCGHAHIDHGEPAPPPNEPLTSVDNARMYDRWKALATASDVRLDPDPTGPGWRDRPL